MIKVGMGFDVHRLVPGRKLILGGVHVPFEKGLLGHSDADVLLHAIMDSMLGALGENDIGHHYPPSNDQYKDVSSMKLMGKTMDLVRKTGFRVNNMDSVIIAQAPKMTRYIQEMKKNIARILKIKVSDVAVKATTTERLGYLGKGEGIAAHAIITLERKEKNDE